MALHAATFLDNLNTRQREAVTAPGGPILVLAGAGTGKTRVITYRIAHLVAQGVPPWAILGVTFTNKAAEEMKGRVSDLLGRQGRDASEIWIGTFHAFCARLLRREASRLGLRNDFAIYDEDDQLRVVKSVLAAANGEETDERPREILSRISREKNRGREPEDVRREADSDADRVVARVFAAYEETLRRCGGLDFDDLLLRAEEVLRRFPEAREKWSGRYAHVLVDEFQDTNQIQYQILRNLLRPEKNLFVVGDEDQAIYSWRGCDVNIMLRFETDFDAARIIRLEENYRSTQSILNAAAGVVGKNVQRLGKTLVATRGGGANLRYFEARDAASESEYVAGEILRLRRNEAAARFAVLYRTNAQSRAFEETLRRMSLRFRVVGGFSFYHRAEVKDALAYVRLLLNPNDDVALLRVVNTPPRGVGPKAISALRELAQQRSGSLWDAIGAQLERGGGERLLAPLRGFRELIEGLTRDREGLGPAQIVKLVLDRSGYIEMLAQKDSEEDQARRENLEELHEAVAEGAEQGETLEDFLDRAALVSDADDYDEHAPVTLMTLHSAKGLEFDHVFLAGLEEGLFPHRRSVNKPEALEEERRLCYVGMTRARETLTLTRAVYRRLYASERAEAAEPSRFLAEIPGDLIETAEGSLASPGETRRYEYDPEYSYSPEEFRRRSRHAAEEDDRPAPRAPREPRPARPAARGGNPLIGIRVSHPKFGPGTIIGVEGDPDDLMLTVSFSDYGTKKLKERFANLRRM